MDDVLTSMIIDFALDDLNSQWQKDFYIYWLSQQQADFPPHISVIDPLSMPVGCLPYMAVTEIEETPPHRLRIKIVGEEIKDLVGNVFQRKYVDELPGHEITLRRYNWCIENKKPYITTGKLEFSKNVLRSYHQITLPFVDDDNNVRKLVNILSI